jgi:hypothetical protein
MREQKRKGKYEEIAKKKTKGLTGVYRRKMLKGVMAEKERACARSRIVFILYTCTCTLLLSVSFIPMLQYILCVFRPRSIVSALAPPCSDFRGTEHLGLPFRPDFITRGRPTGCNCYYQ